MWSIGCLQALCKPGFMVATGQILLLLEVSSEPDARDLLSLVDS